VRAILRAEFGKDNADLTLDRGFTGRNPTRYFFVRFAFGNQVQNPGFRRGQ
jgi:hypothetical protein